MNRSGKMVLAIAVTATTFGFAGSAFSQHGPERGAPLTRADADGDGTVSAEERRQQRGERMHERRRERR